MTYALEWASAAHDEWFHLESAPLDSIRAWGVYVIWLPNGKPTRPGIVLRVGSGNIGIRLAIERVSADYDLVDRSRLRVTWATVADHHQLSPGIVRFLSESLHPSFLEFQRRSLAIPVNLPVTA
jgi:hypothetical protein